MDTVFREKKLTDIVEGTMTRSMLSSSEREEEFDLNQMKIMRMVGTSVPPDTLHQIHDKTTGSEMWKALCDLYEGRANKAVMAHRIRCLRNDLWHTKLSSGEDVNKHLSKMFNLRTELASLQYTVEDIDMVEMLLESLPNQLEFENMKAAIRYNPNYGAFTPDSVRDMIRAADSRQKEFRNKNNGRRGNQKHEGSSGGSKDSSAMNSRSQQETSKDSKKQKKVRKCHICESTEHLKADCPERAKVQSGGGATASEQKRKPRGNVAIPRNENEPLRPEREDAEVGVVTGVLDAMMIDARVEAGVSGESQHSSSENEGKCS
ncbi:hypothetical protein PC114_g26150 [Phytophthora cactorum]|nr:hypothetical protein PC114_g26150 [Phytophthora cactorum]KAG3132225.1 hypothetical protein C6341_g23012 [Phytophthora cactorum]